jgi:hypothetical protein
MISSTSIAGISASQPRPNVLAGPETAYRPPPQSLDGMSDDGNMTQAQMDRIVAEKASQHVSYGFQIPSEGSVAQIPSVVRDSSRESSVVAGVHEQTHTPTYKTRNWPSYNEALKRRGSLTIWFDPEMSWEAAPTGRRGRQQTYSDAAIQTCLSMKVLFGMALRQTTGFVESLLRWSVSTGRCPTSARCPAARRPWP